MRVNYFFMVFDWRTRDSPAVELGPLGFGLVSHSLTRQRDLFERFCLMEDGGVLIKHIAGFSPFPLSTPPALRESSTAAQRTSDSSCVPRTVVELGRVRSRTYRLLSTGVWFAQERSQILN